MIRSMTGYGSASLEQGPLRGTVSARSLNHRFLDVMLHLPRRLQPLELELRARVASRVTRGRVELTVQFAPGAVDAEAIVASRPVVASLVKALREMQVEFGLDGGVSVSDLVRFPGALERLEEVGEPALALKEAVFGLVAQALDGLDAMRRGEGERLGRELERGLDAIEAGAARIEERSAASRDERVALLRERLGTLAGDLGLDEPRLYQEAVRAVERHDVAEEVQRLRSHAGVARELVRGDGEAAGKRLDFLAQELMREANTVGSKVQDAPAIQEVVRLKAEIERFREQVQNVE